MEALFVFLSNLVLFLSLTTLAFAGSAHIVLVLRRRRPLRARREGLGAEDFELLRRYVRHDSA